MEVTVVVSDAFDATALGTETAELEFEVRVVPEDGVEELESDVVLFDEVGAAWVGAGDDLLLDE